MPQRYHNVIVFGAGASVNAGIPLLGGFLDRMWEFAIRGKVGNREIPQDERRILADALEITKNIERYHSRASFDSRNIEDVLSILYFETLGGGRRKKSDYRKLVRAIAVTIELAGSLKFQDQPPERPFTDTHPNNYHLFWRILQGKEFGGNPPAIISFNYDLVFERALWESFHRLTKGGDHPRSCVLDYGAGNRMCVLEEPHGYEFRADHSNVIECRNGFKAKFSDDIASGIRLPYLKLHGSLNWASNPNGVSQELPTKSVRDPLILPPVFNKLASPTIHRLWATALDHLRKATHLIIVGYSLPRTDIYMQYFSRRRLGRTATSGEFPFLIPCCGMISHSRENRCDGGTPSVSPRSFRIE